jgi:predicted DNA repair protein MutK
MLWVGGSIVVHGLEALGWGWLGHLIEDSSMATARAIGWAPGLVRWLTRAALDGVFGLVLGLLLIPPGTRLIAPLWARLTSMAGKN